MYVFQCILYLLIAYCFKESLVIHLFLQVEAHTDEVFAQVTLLPETEVANDC